MPVYLALSLRPDTGALNAAVEKHIGPDDRFHLANDKGWFVRFAGTTIELSNHLTITGQDAGQPAPLGSALVVPVTTYYGRASSDTWEWLKTRIEL